MGINIASARIQPVERVIVVFIEKSSLLLKVI
jgi:hypothetical protein